MRLHIFSATSQCQWSLEEFLAEQPAFQGWSIDWEVGWLYGAEEEQNLLRVRTDIGLAPKEAMDHGGCSDAD